MKRRGIALVLMLGLGIVVWQGIVQDRNAHRGASTELPFDAVTELYLIDFEAWSMDSNGRLDHQLTGSRMEQYRGDGSRQLWNPVLLVHEPGSPSWTIRSEKARVSPAGDEILLQGLVFMDRPGDTENLPVSVESSEVTFWPETRRSQTRQHARITTPFHQVESLGMRIDLGLEIVELDSFARGVYAPQ